MIRSILIILFAAAFAVVPACSSEALDPTKMPMPGAYLPKNTYRLKIEFSSVLNLPGRAKVDSGGVQVGLLDRVELKGTTPWRTSISTVAPSFRKTSGPSSGRPPCSGISISR